MLDLFFEFIHLFQFLLQSRYLLRAMEYLKLEVEVQLVQF